MIILSIFQGFSRFSRFRINPVVLDLNLLQKSSSAIKMWNVLALHSVFPQSGGGREGGRGGHILNFYLFGRMSRFHFCRNKQGNHIQKLDVFSYYEHYGSLFRKQETLKLVFLNKYINGLKFGMKQASTWGVPRKRLLQKIALPKGTGVNMWSKCLCRSSFLAMLQP